MKNIVILIIFISFSISAMQVFGQAKTDPYKMAQADYKQAEADMNDLYAKILKAYANDTEFIKKLKESQRIWVLSRDANLGMIFTEHKGKPEEYGKSLATCKIWELKDLTDERIDFLNQWVDGVEDGTDCAGTRKATGDDGE